MDTEKFKANWKTIRDRARKQWTDLTDDDLRYDEGREDELFERIHQRTGKTRDIIKGWFNQQMTGF